MVPNDYVLFHIIGTRSWTLFELMKFFRNLGIIFEIHWHFLFFVTFLQNSWTLYEFKKFGSKWWKKFEYMNIVQNHEFFWNVQTFYDFLNIVLKNNFLNFRTFFTSQTIKAEKIKMEKKRKNGIKTGCSHMGQPKRVCLLPGESEGCALRLVPAEQRKCYVSHLARW